MTREQAKDILLLYRPGTRDAEEPEVVEAMAVVLEDTALRRWFEQHCTFQAATRARFREIQVPESLKSALFARRKGARP
jgi:hypothetical protein